jgi:hypothetical protein
MQRVAILEMLRSYAPTLRRFPYGKHILTRMEKMTSKSLLLVAPSGAHVSMQQQQRPGSAPGGVGQPQGQVQGQGQGQQLSGGRGNVFGGRAGAGDHPDLQSGQGGYPGGGGQTSYGAPSDGGAYYAE